MSWVSFFDDNVDVFVLVFMSKFTRATFSTAAAEVSSMRSSRVSCSYSLWYCATRSAYSIFWRFSDQYS